MPRRPDLHSVLVIGSGPIVIGQAAEFDYSGTQACRVLREEGLRVILVNSNPATIMTDPDIADVTYIEPIDPAIIRSIIAKERPDAILPTLGGQTALNAAIALAEDGTLEEFGVEMIGASLEAIQKAEDRQKFKEVVERVGGESARSRICHTMDELLAAADELGYPMVVRPSFTMGGLGSGMAYDEADLRRIGGDGLHYSPTSEVLLEESILGWKEFELELMRDGADNCVVICSIENVDPVGVHTGDSVTVAPALTLTDVELQHLRDLGIAIIREVGVDTGGCNVQFATHPETGRVVVIEMNPRVSRSSALASKATGFPIAKIAARVAIGYTLDEIRNDITGTTPASFEPALDYVVVKVPRFAFEKFPAADPTLTTTMKSVGEAMALGRNFTEALGKAQRSVDVKGAQLDYRGEPPTAQEITALLDGVRTPTAERLREIARILWAAAEGVVDAAETVQALVEATAIDPWFLDQMLLVAEIAAEIRRSEVLDAQLLRLAKRHGLSDEQIGALSGRSAEVVKGVRQALGITPVFKTVDTCAGEFASRTPYHYSSYDQETEIQPRERPAILILGSGPNRIGQGIEFDYSCVHAALALGDPELPGGGYETVMVNCNPETVSTDYDIADRLYFEPLTVEDVIGVYEAEKAAGPVAGVIVQLGGQTPLSLARRLEAEGLPIIGTSPAAIDNAEDRGHFGAVLAQAELPAPPYGTAWALSDAIEVAARVGYPVLVRPSYVLGGRGMEIVFDQDGLVDYVSRNLPDGGRAEAPILIDSFLDTAIEIDVDALYDGTELYLAGVMEHIEEAGIHSGDSACTLPPITLSAAMIERIRTSTRAIAEGVGVRGLLNVQFALSQGTLYVLEANPRASRTVPFVAKATGVALARAAALLMAGTSIADLRRGGVLPAEGDGTTCPDDAPIAVKEAVLPFKRFRTREGRAVDSILGPEMRSTGEVMGLDSTFPLAFAKSQLAISGQGLPTSGRAFVSVSDRDKRSLPLPVARLAALGFEILTTAGTGKVLQRYGIPARVLRKASEAGDAPSVIDLIESGEVDLVLNTPSGSNARVDGYAIRAAATSMDVPMITTLQEFQAAVQAIEARPVEPFEVRSLQDLTVQLTAAREPHSAAGAGR
ncbi:carbamoyl-phosphate synthase large subunit [Brachybacterium sp. UMB0905]|uniref:carbamoyl-phosphate synthase large subunit n=1 Tax=Brachybacterium sp. UMB0905 TaxID=2069310 RepID=UPI000C8098C0|nr:carbamoyl-phosphate synthase large subunit [Brachybacterium sp. UMB0905]PMC75816.1 carbamoyl phosphate synthase large subunit [Brachybacterium sp. UMB0905]